MLDDKYLEDSSVQQGYYENSPLSSILSANNLVIGSVLATGSILAYRSGLLAPAIKSFMKGSAERKPTASIIFNDLRKWFESDGIQEVEKSVFRKGGIKNTLKAFREMNVEEARNILNQTKDDVNNYISRLNETLDEFMSKNSNDIIENTANNTELLWNIKKANNAADFYSDEMIEARNVMKSKMYEDIMEKRIQTAESAAEQLKRKGLRKAQLSDLASYEIDSKGNIKLYDKTNYTFRAKDTDDVEIATRQIEDMLNSKRYTDGGIAISKNGQDMRVYQAKDNFMNMVVDDNLYIDRAGNFVDLRKKKVQRTEFIRNLATEWQIPVIGVNPLQMFGIDKIGKKTIPYATISEKTLAPSITGLYGRDKANTIQNAKSTIEKLKGVKEGVTIINGDVYRISDDLKGITKIDYKYKKHVTEIPREMDRGTIALNRRENSQRKMFGLSKKEFEDYKPEDGWRYQFQKVAKFFDIGYQESNSIKESLDGIAEGANPDSFIESLVGRFRIKPYKSQTTVKTFSGISDFRDTPKNSFFVTNESISLKDVYINKFNKDIVKDYFKQYAADFTKNPDIVNAKTSIPFFLIERTNQSLGTIGLALSENSTKSTWDTAKNMVLKRFLPAYGAYEVWNLLNTFGEEDTDNGKKAGNIQQRMAELYANIDIGLHNVADKLGISKVAKNLAEITPGSDMIGELPGINMINATQTGEERAEYWQHGYDPVRKGRYWSMNSSTPFIGGKIQYWKPNFLRRSMADAKYSDSLYGSRRERFAHILNPNYYDIKNYNTRPYLMTSPAFENVPLIGPLLAGTVGKIVKPQKRMHEEYWNENAPKSQQQIDNERRLQAIKTNSMMIQYNNQRRAEQSEKVKFNSQKDLGYIATLKELANVANDDMMANKLRDSDTIQKVYKFTSQIPNVNQSKSIFGNNDETMYSNGSYPVEMIKAMVQEKGMLQAYQTNSGAVSTIQLSSATGSFDKNKVNKKGYRLGQIMNVKENASAKDQSIITPDMINNVKMINPENPNDLSNTFSNQFKNATEVAGMYGFMGEAFVTGRPGQGNTVIETSGYHRSFNKAFWDQDFGGLSGDLSEIFRRYTQRRRTDQHYYNPIRNRMPDWLPGQGAFIDFQHGDAFCLSKDTLVLTNKGYIKADNVHINDMILTHRGNAMPIKNIIKRPMLKDEKSYKLEVSGIDKKISLEFSENHPILIKKIRKCSFGSSCLCRPDVRNFNNFCDTHNCNCKWDKDKIDFVKAKNLTIGDAVVFPIPKIENEITSLNYSYEWKNAPRSKAKIIKGSLNLNCDIAWLLGLYLAEGSTAKRNGIPQRLIFSLNKSEKDVINRVCNLLYNICGKKPSLKYKNNSVDIVLCDSKTARIFNSIIPGNLYQKRIPVDIYNTSKEIMHSMLFGFMLGDGTVQRNQLIGTTANKMLAFDLHKLSMYSGIPAGIIIRNTRKAYEINIHAFHLRKLNLDDLMYKKDKLDLNFKRQPNVLSWSDGNYIYSLIKDIKEIKLTHVYGFEVDTDDTFCVIGFATHNTKISHGEERLPGEGYERLNDINMPEILKMKVGSSTIGKTKDEIIKHFLHQDEITDPELQDIVDTGTKQHEKIEKQLLDSGIGIDAEQEIKDEKNGIVGYYDIKLHDRTSLTGEAIMDIKTVGASKLEKIRKSGKPIDAHQRQVNWYLHETNPFNKGYIYYVDRDDPDNNYTVGFNYSHSLYKSTMNTLKEARDETMDMLNKGIISRGDFYEPLDRLRILADVAPYSDEFRQMNKQLSAMKLTDEQSDELKRIRDRVTQQRQQTRFYGYRFKYADVIAEKGTVERQIDAETYMIKGSDTPIKLAGLNITKKQENYQEAMDLLDKYMSKGNDIKILVAEDPTQRKNGDLLGSVKATVISNGVNVNRELIKRGLAEEKTDDFSAPAVHARFNAIERGFGSAWETMAHFDSFINNKLLAVRTAKEDYERRQVYGKDFKSWDHPIEDFVKPFLWTNMNRAGLFGIAAGSLTGYMLGRTSYGKFVGAIAGGLSIAGLKAYKAGYEAVKGERWIPKEKERQRELDDYIDKLKFIKNRRLFEVYAEKAKREDNFDVKQFIEDNKRKGNARKARANKIKEVKKDYKRTGDFDIKAFEKAGVEFDWKDKLFAPIRSIITGEGREKFKDAFERIMDIGVDEQKQAENAYKKHSPIIWQEIANRVEELLGSGPEPPKRKDIHWKKAHRRGSIKQQVERTAESITDAVDTSKRSKKRALERTVNKKINDNTTKKTVFNLPKNAMIAMEYYNASEATMYGYDPGEPLTNLMSALPKRDRNYFREFLKAPKRDRQEILSMAPKYMRRALQSAYGMKVDDKEDLAEYFSKHYLPDEDWDGWQENFDLESMKVKMIQTQGDRLQDYGKWEDDKIKADMYGPMQIPNMSRRTKSIQEVKNTLEDLLGSAGYKNLNFEFQLGASTPSINLDVYQSKKDKYDKKLRERLGI